MYLRNAYALLIILLRRKCIHNADISTCAYFRKSPQPVSILSNLNILFAASGPPPNYPGKDARGGTHPERFSGGRLISPY